MRKLSKNFIMTTNKISIEPKNVSLLKKKKKKCMYRQKKHGTRKYYVIL